MPSRESARFPPEPFSSPLSFTVSGLTSAQDDRLPIFDISFTAEAGKITGIFGLPGSGIETLEIVLSGMRKPDSGTIEIGDDGCLTVRAKFIHAVQSFYERTVPLAWYRFRPVGTARSGDRILR